MCAVDDSYGEVVHMDYQDEMKATITASNGKVVGYFQIQADRKVDGEKVKKSIGEIESDTRDVAGEMRKTF